MASERQRQRKLDEIQRLKLIEDMEAFVAKREYGDAALAALKVADAFCQNTSICALYHQRALTYATLHQADTVVWVAENRRERMP